MRGAVHQGTYEKSGSLGLRLYIASEIAKAHHGAIDAWSNDTQTLFSVSLPRADA
jgi:nitrogen-specific signal transduction histidine kinase